MKNTYKKLEPIYGSSLCQYSIIENDLAKVYRNQAVIYDLLKDINENLIRNEAKDDIKNR